jgi:uncharacterized membrane protein YeaQ/YmgE (transglycosylase-associated protein family)
MLEFMHLNHTHTLHGLVEAILTWIGFGVVCGLAAKAILPGRDPGGALTTLGLGCGGAFIGLGVFSLVTNMRIRDLISPMGFALAIAGAIVLLIAHRVLSGRLGGGIPTYVEQVYSSPEPHYTRRRRRYSNDYD